MEILLRFRIHASRILACHIAAKIGGPAGETRAHARWKNILTAYARLEIGERLCKTWLAHFKCRNAKQPRRSRCIAVWGWIAAVSTFAGSSFHPISIMVLRASPKSRIFEEISFRGNDSWHDIVTISLRYHRDITHGFSLPFVLSFYTYILSK